MKASTKRFASAVLALFVLIISFVVFFDFVQPTYGDMMQLKGKLATENEMLQNESTTVAQVNKVLAAYNGQNNAQTMISAALPIGQNISNALAQVYGLAQASNINIQNTAVSVSVPQTAMIAAAAKGNSVGLTLKPTSTIAFNITASGNYESFLNFLSGIETNMRIFDVKQVSIQPVSVSGKGANPDFFNYLVTVNTYYQLP